MKTINLKEMYSDYYIRAWKKQGLVLITQRPPTTTETLLNNFFNEVYSPKKKYKTKAIQHEFTKRGNKKLDWRDYVKEEY